MKPSMASSMPCEATGMRFKDTHSKLHQGRRACPAKRASGKGQRLAILAAKAIHLARIELATFSVWG